MTTYRVERTIDASPESIWALLTDADGYPGWNPAVVSIDGTITLGGKISLISAVNPKRAFKLTVTEFDPPRTMVWSGGMPLGLFTGVRTYTVAAGASGQSTFSMEEVFSGLMEPLISKSIPDMTESFNDFGDGLKQAAES